MYLDVGGPIRRSSYVWRRAAAAAAAAGADGKINILPVNALAYIVCEQAPPHMRLQIIHIWTKTEKG